MRMIIRLKQEAQASTSVAIRPVVAQSTRVKAANKALSKVVKRLKKSKG